MGFHAVLIFSADSCLASENNVAKACGTTERGTTPTQLLSGSEIFGFDDNNITFHNLDIPDGQDAKSGKPPACR